MHMMYMLYQMRPWLLNVRRQMLHILFSYEWSWYISSPFTQKSVTSACTSHHKSVWHRSRTMCGHDCWLLTVVLVSLISLWYMSDNKATPVCMIHSCCVPESTSVCATDTSSPSASLVNHNIRAETVRKLARHRVQSNVLHKFRVLFFVFKSLDGVGPSCTSFLFEPITMQGFGLRSSSGRLHLNLRDVYNRLGDFSVAVPK